MILSNQANLNHQGQEDRNQTPPSWHQLLRRCLTSWLPQAVHQQLHRLPLPRDLPFSSLGSDGRGVMGILNLAVVGLVRK